MQKYLRSRIASMEKTMWMQNYLNESVDPWLWLFYFIQNLWGQYKFSISLLLWSTALDWVENTKICTKVFQKRTWNNGEIKYYSYTFNTILATSPGNAYKTSTRKHIPRQKSKVTVYVILLQPPKQGLTLIH